MCVDRPGAVDLLLRAGQRKRVQLAVDAPDRRAVLEGAILWLATDDRTSATPRLRGQSQTGATPDATHGPAGHLSEAQDVVGRRWAQGLSLSAPRPRDYTPESGVECRYYVRPIDNTFAKMKWKKIGFCRSVGLSELPSTQKDKSRCLPFYHSYSVFIRSLP